MSQYQKNKQASTAQRIHELTLCSKTKIWGLWFGVLYPGDFLTGKYKPNQTIEEDSRRKDFDFPPLGKEKAYKLDEISKMEAEYPAWMTDRMQADRNPNFQ